ncbi:MAG: hypothetical protein EAZ06_01070 [Cytophagales bacterium]|nr:MAG: hypothetical protein EAZ06_01070 [Cytophagales bacterium]
MKKYFIFFFVFFSCNYQQEKKVSLKKNDVLLYWDIFSPRKNYRPLVDVETSYNRSRYIKTIKLSGKKSYIPENLYLFDSLKRLMIELPNLKNFPKLEKMKSLSYLYIEIGSFPFPNNVILFPKNYAHIDKSISCISYNERKKIQNIIFPDDMKIESLSMSITLEQIPKTLKNLRYLKVLDIKISSTRIFLEFLPQSLEKLTITLDNIEEFDFNKLPKNIKRINLTSHKGIFKDYKKILEEGKKRKIFVSINNENNGLEYPEETEHYYWIEW